MRFEILKSADDEFFFHIVASNGKILAHSQTYNHYDDCLHAAKLIMQQAATADLKDMRNKVREDLRKKSFFFS